MHLFVYARHQTNCSKKSDRFWRRCRCPKWIRGILDGKSVRVAAWTTDWEVAEAKAREMEQPLYPLTKVAQPAPGNLKEKSQRITIEEAVEAFLDDEQGRQLRKGHQCCRRLLGITGILSGQRYCYVLTELNDGRPPLRIGLHKDVTLGGISYPGDMYSLILMATIKGRDLMQSSIPKKTAWTLMVCRRAKETQMYKDWSDAPISASGNNYKLLGPNSNTFVSDFLRYFGLVPPPVRRVPGFGK